MSLDCPEDEGYFKTPGSDQCFKAYRDELRTWEAGDEWCKAQGLELAQPQNHNAAWIQTYLRGRYGMCY